MATPPRSLVKLREYAGKVKETDYGLEIEGGEEDYEARLNRSLQSLQDQVKRHEATLQNVVVLRPGLQLTC